MDSDLQDCKGLKPCVSPRGQGAGGQSYHEYLAALGNGGWLMALRMLEVLVALGCHGSKSCCQGHGTAVVLGSPCILATLLPTTPSPSLQAQPMFYMWSLSLMFFAHAFVKCVLQSKQLMDTFLP